MSSFDWLFNEYHETIINLPVFYCFSIECDDEILKNWIFEDEFLVRFIRGRKYNMKSAFEKVNTP